MRTPVAVIFCIALDGCHSPGPSELPGPEGDASIRDAAAGGDAAGAAGDAGADGGSSATFPCGFSTCSAGTEFCYQIEAGARPQSGDGGVTAGCNPIPQVCLPGPKCDCLKSLVQGCPSAPGLLSCQQMDGGFYVTCALP